jgi:LPXTG-motif cell wall-anchored protein
LKTQFGTGRPVAQVAGAIMLGLGLVAFGVTPASAAPVVSSVIDLGISGNGLGVAFSPDGLKAYVADGAGDISVIDATTDTLDPSVIATGEAAVSVVFSPDGAKAYATNPFRPGVTVIDVALDTVNGVIDFPLGSLPNEVAFSPLGLKAYAANNGNNTVSVITVATDSLAAPVSDPGTLLSGPRSIDFSPDGSKAYVTNSNGTVAVIDADTNTVTDSITLPGFAVGERIRFSKDGLKAYANTVSSLVVIDVATDSLLPPIALPAGADSLSMALSPDGLKAYVTNVSGGKLYVVDLASGTVETIAPAGAGQLTAVAFRPTGSAGTKAYVVNFVPATSLSSLFVITDAPPAGPALAATGVSGPLPLSVGGALLLAGGLFVVVRRRMTMSGANDGSRRVFER